MTWYLQLPVHTFEAHDKGIVAACRQTRSPTDHERSSMTCVMTSVSPTLISCIQWRTLPHMRPHAAEETAKARTVARQVEARHDPFNSGDGIPRSEIGLPWSTDADNGAYLYSCARAARSALIWELSGSHSIIHFIPPPRPHWYR